jgi:hypothetical protein
MEPLTNEFTVHRPIAQAWAVLTDIERIAPCMKGAQLEEIEGDVYRGVLKLKLGPIATQFKGQAHFVERDDVNHRGVIKGEGRDTGGKGNAEALISAHLEEVGPALTKVVVVSDIKLTGKVAQFGRLGVIRDTSEKLMSDFAHNLNTMLEADASEPAAPAAAEPAASAAAEPAAAASAADGAAAEPAQPTVRKINGPAAEPIVLSDVAGTAMLKKALPLVGGLVVLVLILRRIFK